MPDVPPPRFDGSKFRIESLVLADGSSPAEDFLNALSDSDLRKLNTLFERLGNHGKITNSEKFKKVEGSDGILEFKSFQIRVFCFFAGPGLLKLAFGLKKQKDKHKASDIRRAEEYRAWYLEERK